MPLEPYLRGRKWWVRGTVDYNGSPITAYYRRSTGTLTEEAAREWVAAETDRQRRRYLIGEETSELTFAEAVTLYPAKPKDAGYLIPLVKEIGERTVSSLTPKEIRALGPKLYPKLSTDTWQRYVVTPVKAVILNAHEEGLCPPIRIKSYSKKERIEQDERRGKQSRAVKSPFTRKWVDAFAAEADIYNAAMVRFIFETAARIDQVVSLEPNHLDLMNHRVLLKAQKGHPEQWVKISTAMVVTLANLPPRQPKNRRTGVRGKPRVFGYAGRSGMLKAWKTICKNAGIEYLSPHSGRHGFYTELRVNQGVDPVTAAKMGRWSNHALPDKTYAHTDAEEAEIRERFRTIPVQPETPKKAKGRK
ncbi:tyrosine-type recombinase/integrase [Thiosulfatihalobacter marinus]|uniref:tyrosine-type recombinase/integrase n=1 Tax=Thiosulfatihalobacter marinus TaxID=2792481 RepID=UPI0018D9CABB|nr:tyrosine-type recombinase/integrase [Thiosulfatihalobacter marinus]